MVGEVARGLSLFLFLCFISLTPPARLQLAITMAKLCMLLLMASPLISALVVTRAAPTAVVAPTLARSCDVAAAVRTQQRAAVVMMGRGGGQREERPRKEKVAKDVLELDGTVLESLPNAMFRVQLMDSEQARTHAHSRAFPTWVACTPHAHTPCDPIERGTHTLVAGDSRPHLGQDPQELHQDPGTPTPTAIASTTVPSTTVPATTVPATTVPAAAIASASTFASTAMASASTVAYPSTAIAHATRGGCRPQPRRRCYLYCGCCGRLRA
jgi:hypothetical protein